MKAFYLLSMKVYLRISIGLVLSYSSSLSLLSPNTPYCSFSAILLSHTCVILSILLRESATSDGSKIGWHEQWPSLCAHHLSQKQLAETSAMFNIFYSNLVWLLASSILSSSSGTTLPTRQGQHSAVCQKSYVMLYNHGYQASSSTIIPPTNPTNHHRNQCVLRYRDPHSHCVLIWRAKSCRLLRPASRKIQTARIQQSTTQIFVNSYDLG